MRKKDLNLLDGNIASTLYKLTLPMIIGILGIVIFNVVDTYYVAKLGVPEVAALTFTFPVVLVISSLAQGIGVGASALISRVVGEKNQKKVIRYTTDSLILGVSLVIIFVVFGLMTIEPLFRALGADDVTLPIIKEYMRIWYPGVIFVIIPMIGNSCIRALGDTKVPAMIMTVAAVANFVLDPILIFGFGPIPAMGVKGAAIATVIARALTLVVSIYVLKYKRKMISLKNIHINELLNSFKELLYIGLPNALTKIMQPVMIGAITVFISKYGEEAVASFGITSRIEMFLLLIPSSLIAVYAPFIGQNLGAMRIERIKESYMVSIKAIIYISLLSIVFLFLGKEVITGIFTQDAKVVEISSVYLLIVPFSYLFQGILNLSTTALNVLNKPIESAVINIVRIFVICLPLAKVLSKHIGLNGIWISIVISFVVMAIFSFKLTSAAISNLSESENKLANA